MVSKFYTPTTEEFHIGFEYEITNGYDWVKKTFSHEDFSTFLYKHLDNAIDQEQIRVKYLDEKDMTELGWLFCNTDNFGYDVFTKTIETGFNTGAKYYVYISPSNPGKIFIKWETYSSYDFENGQIGMFIKNRSEFKNFFDKLSIG